MVMTIGSLFSGVGGLELGLERAGFGPVIWQAEIDPYCRAVLARHWPDARRFADVREVRRGVADRVDVVCGGFPCQPVSVAGKRLAQADARWLWPEYARVARELQPACVVAENVPGLRSAGLRDVLADLAELGFDVEWSHLSAAEVGAPHKRVRVWIVATHPDRIDVREQPGWLSRACGARASEPWDDGETGALADTKSRRWLECEAGRIARSLDAASCVSDSPGDPQASTAGGCRQARLAIADAPGLRDARPEGDGRQARPVGGERSRSDELPFRVGVGSSDDADTEGQSQPPWSLAAERGWARDSGWRDAPPAVRRMDDGLPGELDASSPGARGRKGKASDGVEAPDGWRIGVLGNAVVPQVAEVIARALLAALGQEAAA